jgi:acetyl-CoA acetyltransferase family protein
MNMGRIAAMAAGFPKEVAATTVTRFCSSGSQAIAMAAHEILNEGAEVAIGAGVETITMMQDGTSNRNRMVNATAQKRFPGLYFPMGLTAEIVAERYKISREDQDLYALQSQQRYAKAVKEGKVAEDIVPMTVRRRIIQKDKEPYDEDFTVAADECNRADTTLEGLAKLQPVFKKAEEGGTVTAGNASQLSDGASATLLMSSTRAKQLGIEPLGIYRGTAVAGCGPEEMGIGPCSRCRSCSSATASSSTTSTSSSSTRRSRRSCSTASASSASTTTSSTRSAARSRSDTRSG